MKRNRRTKKLIRPALQFRITLAFMSTSIIVLATMGVLVSWFLRGEALDVPPGAQHVVDQVMTTLSVAFGITMALLVPLTLFVGLKVTHLVAGPMYRLEMYLGEVIRGERPADCQLRKGDELQDICDLINEATRPVREQGQGEEESPAGENENQKAA